MKRVAVAVGLVACLVAAARAQDDAGDCGFFSATYLEWEGGDRTLADTVAWLAASGNPTILSPDLDGSVGAPLGFVAGTYWEAVEAVCAAYHLYVVPSTIRRRPQDAPAETGRLPVAVEVGPVVLALVPGKKLGGIRADDQGDGRGEVDVERLRQDPEALRAFLDRKIRVANRRRNRGGQAAHPPPPALTLNDGPLLIGIKDAGIWSERSEGTTAAEARISYRLRLEPRFTPAEVGVAELAWDRVFASDGLSLSADGEAPPPQGRIQAAMQARMRVNAPPDQLRVDGDEAVPLVTQILQGIDPHAGGFGFSGRLHLGYRFGFGQRVELAPGQDQQVPVRGELLTVELRRDPAAVLLRHPADARWLEQLVVNVSRRTGGLLPNEGVTTVTADGITTRTFALGVGLEDAVYRVHLGSNRQERMTSVPLSFYVEIP